MPKRQSPLEGFSFTTSEAEAASVYLLVTEAGFPPTSQGVKDYLLFKAGTGEAAKPGQDEDAGEEEDMSDKIGRILEALERNPQVTQFAIEKGTKIFGSLLGRLRGGR